MSENYHLGVYCFRNIVALGILTQLQKNRKYDEKILLSRYQ